MIQIDLCYFEGCPSWQEGLQNLESALAQLGSQAQICMLKVEDDAQAEKLRFLGSPSFQVDGQDLWPAERKRYYLSCRVYPTPNGMCGAPTIDMLVEKLKSFPTHS